jgi:hypothetical protein
MKMSACDSVEGLGMGTLYRVEHHEAGMVRSLGALPGVAPHYRTLDPFVSALLRDGRAGEVLLVEVATGRTVARRRVHPPRTKAPDCFRRPNDLARRDINGVGQAPCDAETRVGSRPPRPG